MPVRASPYLFQTVTLLSQCKTSLEVTISHIRFSPGRFEALFRLKRSIAATERLLLSYICKILDDYSHSACMEHTDIVHAITKLKHVLRCHGNGGDLGESQRNTQDQSLKRTYFQNTGRQSVDSQLLFRLIVDLQLMLVRIEDAYYVITGHRIVNFPGSIDDDIKDENFTCTESNQHFNISSISICFLGIGLIAGCFGQKYAENQKIQLPFAARAGKRNLMITSVKTALSLGSALILKGFLNVCWMTDKIVRSNNELISWNEQWSLEHSCTRRARECGENCIISHEKNSTRKYRMKTSATVEMDDKSKAILDYAKNHRRQSSFWRSTGEIRFLMLKRFMDIYYASVRVGVHCAKDHPHLFVLPLVTGAVASFYAITGVATPTVVNDSSRDLIQHAWGMVSIPALKDLMLQASKLIKGASVAERITLCGVPCFVLSKDPAPELAAILQLQAKQRYGDHSLNLSQLSTIAETEIHIDTTQKTFSKNNFVGNEGQYRQRDVILHLTGGGFFAHTIASDLPYLLDWSASTGSVIICPEYALLPEHQFPSQLNQVATIYGALANGRTGIDLGFVANSIIITGESAGGNLAAALCVELANVVIDSENQCNDIESSSPQLNVSGIFNHSLNVSCRMPAAVMLSCPVLDLTTGLSPPRTIRAEDPVLPKALISAISKAYIPSQYDHRNPLVSPIYATDDVLSKFPPTLLFASSNDPLLDDSVTFNERLRVVGVDSELIAVHNVPHAYLGLGTAGFPEAIQVQKHAREWLSSKLS